MSRGVRSRSFTLILCLSACNVGLSRFGVLACPDSGVCPAGLVCDCGESSGGPATGGTSSGTSGTGGSAGGGSGGQTTGGTSGVGASSSGTTGGSTSAAGGTTGSGSSSSGGTGTTSGTAGTSGGSSGAASCLPTGGSGLCVFAGQIGGPGTLASGLGSGSRLDLPVALTGDGDGGLLIAQLSGELFADVAGGMLSNTFLLGNEDPGLGLAYDGTELWFSEGTGYGVLGAYAYPADSAERCVGDVGASGQPIGFPTCTGDDAGLFASPQGLAWLPGAGGAGTLYVADQGNDTVDVVSLPSLVVSTLAGQPYDAGSDDGVGTAARFDGPVGLALDGDGGLYVTDQGNATLRRIDLASRAVTTVAGEAQVLGWKAGGPGNNGFVAPAGVAVSGSEVYVADRGANVIGRFDAPSAGLSLLAGTPGLGGSQDGLAGAATFLNPAGLYADGLGHLLVADESNDVVRAVDTGTGDVTTLLGLAPHQGEQDGVAGAALFDGPAGICWDGQSTLFVVDFVGNAIRRVDMATASVTLLAGSGYGYVDGPGASAEFAHPAACVADTGHVYVSDVGNEAVREIDVRTGQVATLAGGGPAGYLDATGVAAEFDGPQGLALDGLGTLYVADLGNERIRSITLDGGMVATLAGTGSGHETDGPALDAGFVDPEALVYASGSLYVGEGSGNLRQITLPGAAVSTVSTSTYPITALAFEGDGGFYAGDGQYGLVEIRPPNGLSVVLPGAGGVVAGPSATASVNSCQGLVFVPGSGLFLTDLNENAVLLLR
ncbi:MAG TPA: hypothetical protein VMB50_00740 [Myxococcales bacterium]|nr:hypothetical protein [Myxococcales bacterium]